MQIALELAKVCLYFRVRFHSKLVLFTHVIIFLCLEKRVSLSVDQLALVSDQIFGNFGPGICRVIKIDELWRVLAYYKSSDLFKVHRVQVSNL